MKIITMFGHRVEITYRANAKRVNLRYMPGADHFTMSAPPGCPDSLIREFLKKNQSWMRSVAANQPAPKQKGSAGTPAVNGWLAFEGWKIKATVRSNSSRFILHHRPHEDFFTLTVPKGGTQEAVAAYLSQNTEWMRKAMEKLPMLDWQPQYAAGERHWVLGRLVTLGQNGVPCGETALTRYRNEQLKQLLLREVEKWQRIMGVRARSITLKNMRSRWGSCKVATHDLSFSANLGFFPEECVTEVVVHELNHIRHPGHDDAFYADMDRWYPQWKRGHDLKKTFDINPRRPE